MKKNLRSSRAIFQLMLWASAFLAAGAGSSFAQPYGPAPAVGIGARNTIPDNPGTIVTPVTPTVPGSGGRERVFIPNTSRTGAANLEHPCVTAGVPNSC